MQHKDQRGAIAVWASLAIIGFIVVLGIGVDFAGHSAAVQQARSIAAQAARAGGQNVTLGHSQAQLQPSQARAAALDFLRASEYDGTVTLEGNVVHVELTGSYQTQFLSVIGINSLKVAADAESDSLTVVNGLPR